MNTTEIFSDLNVTPVNNTTKVVNIHSVLSAFSRLLNTDRKDRVFRPDLDLGLKDLLFEPVSDIIGIALFSKLVARLLEYEPRLVINTAESSVTPSPTENAYSIKLSIDVPQLNIQGHVVKGSLQR